ncbi:MAG: TIGR01777 family oxidoreductase, partial [Bdellovibrionales bacterium]|nr:TIGR01777 family oxidoreductase [Bdellovibrionales bacterium]
SRVDSTQKIVKLINDHKINLKCFLVGSAIGIYGDSGDENLSESTPAGNDFLGKVCQEWEQQLTDLPSSVRNVALRTGLVLSRQEGLLEKLELPAMYNLLSPLGSGQQFMSWIHIYDWVNAVIECLHNIKIQGAVNLVAPEPVNNLIFTKMFCKQVNKFMAPAIPRFVLQMALGEMSAAILGSQKVQPKALMEHGFKFRFENLTQALEHLYPTPIEEKLYIQRQWFQGSPKEIFPFFSQANNLEKITPPFLNFKVNKVSTSSIAQGTVIDYSLKLHGIPLHWRSEIAEWQPPKEFVDIQLKGPYNKWHHRHQFTPLAGGTLMEDVVQYRLPFTRLSQWFLGFKIKNDIEKIFSFRKKYLDQNIDEIRQEDH